ncbi:hypothetical protein OHS71_01225 [Streptomyces sp. NBC_00377]|uniref:hypothetical protein n=1 Tax=unclassified Streptomyces TaxID=2593676 RepID=UPI002E1DE165|nr:MULTISPECIES: hypothetical protein [unclassified Streptomyces]
MDTASDWARARGGYSAQALFLAKAAALSTNPVRRAERYLAAAQGPDRRRAARDPSPPLPGLAPGPTSTASQRFRPRRPYPTRGAVRNPGMGDEGLKVLAE